MVNHSMISVYNFYLTYINGVRCQGCELAEFLVKHRRRVTIVHTYDTVGEGIPIKGQLRLFPWFDSKGVILYPGVKYEKITGDGLSITTREDGRKTLKADTCIIAIPVLPDTESVKELSGLVRGDVVPRPRIELWTRGFSVRQEKLCIEILTHLAGIGQAAQELLSSIENNDDKAKYLEELKEFSRHQASG